MKRTVPLDSLRHLLSARTFTSVAIGVVCAMQLPASLADAKTFAYITLPDAGTIAVLDTATNVVTNTLPFGPAPKALAASQNGQHVYVADSGLLLDVDPSKQAVVATSGIGATVNLAISPDGKFIYALHETVLIVDATTNLPLNEVALANHPTGYWNSVAVRRDGTVYFTRRIRDESGTTLLALLDPTAQTVTNVTIPGTYANGIALSPTADVGYVLVDEGIEVLDTTTNTVIKTIPPSPVDFPGFPPGSVVEVFTLVIFSSDGTRAYVQAANSNRILVIDTALHQEIGSISLSEMTHLFARIALAPGDRSLYGLVDSPKEGDPSVIVIDTTTQQVVGTALQGSQTTGSDSQIVFLTLPDAVPGVPDTKTCAALMCTGDSNGDGEVTINEIMTAVSNDLNGCPQR